MVLKHFRRLVGLGAASLGVLFPSVASADELPIDWVISADSLANSKISNSFEHQVHWDFVVAPKVLYTAPTEVVDASGVRLLPQDEQLYSVRSRAKQACTITRVRDRDFVASKKSVCLVDTGADGTFDKVYVGKFRKEIQAVVVEEVRDIVPVQLAEVSAETASEAINGRLWATAAINHEVRLEFFVGQGPYVEWCSMPGGATPSAEPVIMPCGIPGLGIRVENPAAERKSRGLSLVLPTRPIAIVFDRKGLFFRML